ncbi:MAG: lysine--tRNA ligase [Armatimonadetes bacterium]|nr:lysine--tRNA ligase [Armatimonadota bacterium]
MPAMHTDDPLIAQRLAKLELATQRDGDPFWRTRYDVTHHAAEIVDGFEALEGTSVRLAGRLHTLRGKGKAAFWDLYDQSGRIQIFLNVDSVGEEAFRHLGEVIDLGDIVGVEGQVIRTRMGEVSVHASAVTLLTKSLRPPPLGKEKDGETWNRLTDIEARYRRRYVDLFVNRDVRAVFEARSRIVQSIRRTLDERGFLEVETPMLQPIQGGAAARPFITHHNALDMELYLRIAPELYLKRLLVGGFEKVYEINRNFRNEGIDTSHNPEFTMLETYEAYADYNVVMDLTEALVTNACLAVHGKLQIEFDGQEIDLTPPWPRKKLYDIVAEATGQDLGAMGGDEAEREAAARRVAEQIGVYVQPSDGFGQIVDAIFKKYVIAKIVQPTFIIEYPVELSPLAKRRPDKPELTERFQPIIAGLEMGNAFSELNNPIDQRERFEAQARRAQRGDAEAMPYDEDYVTALEYGMPPAGGLGVGIDRLVMLLCDQRSIRDVILFPTMRPD